jgi:uncharacterized protein
MSQRNSYPPGAPCWVDTPQPDPRAAMRFYEGLFGWEFSGPGPMPDDPAGQYYVARLRGRDVAGVGSVPKLGAPPVTAWSTHVAVASAAKSATDARAAGGAVIFPPFDALPAGRMAVLADPSGAVSCAWEPADRQGARLVNEPRAWAMSTLITSEIEACAAFYGKLFGWGMDPFEAGGPDVSLCRLSGYVGGELRQPVPRDVVAVMAPLTSTGPSRWNVDFWIEDADAAASAAQKLGGSIVVPPFEVTGFRTAVLQDPQGAIFSISQRRNI